MSRRRTPGTEERLAELAGVTAAPDPGTAADRLRRALADRSAPVVARAARLTAQLGRSDLAGELEAAFHRILDDPRASDPGCTAKTALAAALVAVDPDGSLEVVADALEDEDDAVAEAAALALGGSRLEAAFRALRDAAGRLVHGGRRRVLLTALALLRRDDAFEHLLGLVESGPTGVAVDAVHALGISRHDDHLRRRVEAAVADRGDARVEDALRASFGG